MPGAKKRVSKSTKLRAEADTLWSLIIRAAASGRCVLKGRDHVACGGAIQAAHCFGRGHEVVRHELWNGWPLCQGHHVYYTHHPEAWEQLLREAWGNEKYETRYRCAKSGAKPDYAAALARLKEFAAGRYTEVPWSWAA